MGFFLFQNTFPGEEQDEETIRSREGKWKGKQNVGIVTDEETRKLLHEIKEQHKEQSRILKEQQAIVNELKKHKEVLEKVTMAGIPKVNVSIKRRKESGVNS